jgi:protein-disulfide isomerase
VVEERFKRRKAVRPLLASLGLVALLVFISACGGGAGSQRAEEEPAEEEAQTTTRETQAAVEKSEVAPAQTREAGADLGTPSLGDEDAPVLMVEYADYQ